VVIDPPITIDIKPTLPKTGGVGYFEPAVIGDAGVVTHWQPRFFKLNRYRKQKANFEASR